MKKAVLTIVGVGVVAGVAAGLLVWKRRAEVGTTPLAQWVPAETVALAELPDLAASSIRWRETALWKILHEPEVQAFLDRPRSKVPKNAAWDDTLDHLRRVQPRRGFLAVTGVVDNMPRVVGGFAFSGQRDEVEALVAKAKAQAQAASPGGKAELSRYQNFEIESFSDKGVTVAGAFAGNWYFVANNLDLLKATLDRFASGSAEGALSGTEIYKKSVSRLPSNPDFRVFLQPAAFFEKLMAFSASAGQNIDPNQAAELRKIQAVAAAITTSSMATTAATGAGTYRRAAMPRR